MPPCAMMKPDGPLAFVVKNKKSEKSFKNRNRIPKTKKHVRTPEISRTHYTL